MSNNPQSKLGLIAGNGKFPLLFAEEARRRGEIVIAVALKEEADPALESTVDDIAWHSLGDLGKTIRYFKERGVSRAVMAGQVKHTQLFKNIVPDLKVIKLLGQVVNKKADTLLSAVIQEFEKEGIQFLSSVLYLEDWLCPGNTITNRKPTSMEKSDIEFGLPIAREIAGQDIGQTIVVKDKTVVAIEAMEGTDACIRRAGQIAGRGCVVIKTARPKQDLRFDVPVVGPRTIDSLIEAGATVMAMEAQKTLLLDKTILLEKANASQLTLTGFRA